MNEISEWEQIAIAPSSSSREWEMVAGVAEGPTHIPYDASSMVFPPSHHEGLQVHHIDREDEQQQQQQQQIQPPRTSLPRRLGLCLKVLGSKIVRIIASSSSRCTGGTCWSSAAAATVLSALVLFCLSRILRRRLQKKELMLRLLIQEKDQEISQLLCQLAHSNEVLSVRRRVSVLRSA